MPSSRSSSNSMKRKRVEVQTDGKRNRDPEIRVPDSIQNNMNASNREDVGDNSNVDVEHKIVNVNASKSVYNSIVLDVDHNIETSERPNNDLEGNLSQDVVIRNVPQQHIEAQPIRSSTSLSAVENNTSAPAPGEGLINSAKSRQSRSQPTIGESLVFFDSKLMDSPERFARIRGLLDHRRLLLKRVRQCRKGAQRRILEQQNENPGWNSFTDEQEIEIHRELISTTMRKQLVTNLSGQQLDQIPQQHTEGGGEDDPGSTSKQQKLSISLRKGAHVGRRMSAALSALAPGGLSSSTAVASAVTHDSRETSHEAIDALDISSNLLYADHSIVDLQYSNKMNSYEETSVKHDHFASHLQTDASVSMSAGGVMPPPSITPKSAHSSGKATAQSKTSKAGSTKVSGIGQKSLKGANASSRTSAALASSAFVYPAYQPTAASTNSQVIKGKKSKDQSAASNSTKNSNKVVNKTQQQINPDNIGEVQLSPRTIFPEAIALRGRRDLLQSKLSDIVMKRGDKHTSLESTVASKSSKSASSSISLAPGGQRATESDPASRRGPGGFAIFPRKRKTHWDVVLQEMRWMATDFIEERKWKKAAAKLVGNEAVLSTRELMSRKAAEVMRQLSSCSAIKTNEHHNALLNDDGANLNPTIRIRKAIKKRSWVHSEVSPENEIIVQGVAKTISCMVGHLVTQSSIDIESDLMNSSDFCKLARTRWNTRNSFCTGNLQKKEAITLANVLQYAPDKSNYGNISLLKEEMFEIVSRRIDDVVQMMLQRETLSKCGGNASFGLALSESQMDLVRQVESTWHQANVGSIIHGAVAAGKTIAVSSILWRKKLDGPQLLICPGSSMIRWIHELSRFSGFYLHTVGLSSQEVSANILASNHVVVCDFSFLKLLTNEKLTAFKTIAIDCRHPAGFAGSRSLWLTQNKVVNGSSGILPVKNKSVPRELTMIEWWNHIVTSTSKGDTCRILISKTGPKVEPPFLEGLSSREMLELLALRLVFLYGATYFHCSNYTVQKSALAWARRRVKGHFESGSKFQRVRELLTELVQPLYGKCGAENSIDLAIESKGLQIPWTLRHCEMVPKQLLAYQRTCYYARAALSNCQQDGDRDDELRVGSFVKAMMCLRYQCTYADIRSALSQLIGTQTTSVHASHAIQILSIKHQRKVCGTAGQIDEETVHQIFQASNKMLELVGILSFDAMINYPGKHIIEDYLGGKHGFSSMTTLQSSPSSSRNIVILADLPEVRLIASVLLNSLGIAHELLMCARRSTCMDMNSEAELSTLEWTDAQLKLSTFNAPHSTKADAYSIVITSLVTVAGDHGGLGVEQADMVICLDEDWSGRGELLMYSLYARCCFRPNRDQLSRVQFIRVLSKSSCECSFLTGSMTETIQKPTAQMTTEDAKLSWPVSPFGLLMPSSSTQFSHLSTATMNLARRYPSVTMFTFPSRNIIASRNADLAKILVAEKPMSQLKARSKLIFLPTGSEDVNLQEERIINDALILEEEMSNPIGCFDEIFQRTTFASIVPPSPEDFRVGLVACVDLPIAPIKLYLENNCGLSTTKDYCLDAKASTSSTEPRELNTRSPVAQQSGKIEDWLNHESIAKPYYPAKSLLFYNAPTDDHASSASILSENIHNERMNFYSKAFSQALSGSTHLDGSLGSEESIFFPPLIPGTMECADIAKKSVENLRSSLSFFDEKIVDVSDKRISLDIDLRESKRQRIDFSEDFMDAEANLSSFLIEEQNGTPKVMTEDEATHIDAASVLLDLSDDYGLAGIGATLLPVDTAFSVATTFIEHRLGGRTDSQTSEWLGAVPSCDAEEYESCKRLENVDVDNSSMVLLVSRKRPRGMSGVLQTSQSRKPLSGMASGHAAYATASTGASGVMENAIISSLHLDSASNKLKKKTTDPRNPAPSLPSMDPEEVLKHRSITTLRQVTAGSTIFEAEPFRVAVTHVKKRIVDRLLENTWNPGVTYDTGPGLPLACSKNHKKTTRYNRMYDVDPNLWTSIVKRLKNKDSTTGGEALELSKAQLDSLHRSLVSPCRVDFGPFQSGFLSSPSGATAVFIPRLRTGVSLPMGVKITPTITDNTPSHWSSEQLQMLQQSVVRFCLNWILVSRVVSGVEDTLVHTKDETNGKLMNRAARTCRDQWHRLIQNAPHLEKEAKTAMKTHVEYFVTGSMASQDNDTIASSEELMLLQKGFISPREDSACRLKKNAHLPGPEGRRGFSALRLAKSKLHQIPIIIPGVPPGGPPTVVASHQSHQQAVQSSIAVSWTGGRTEMWPLQLLDAADRQKVSASAPATINSPAPMRPPTGRLPNQPSLSTSTNGPSSTTQQFQQRHAVASTSIPYAAQPQPMRPDAVSGASRPLAQSNADDRLRSGHQPP